ncbi:MAG: hypothetical protein WC356_05340 [Candidatus Micrarchaeia archaeon]
MDHNIKKIKSHEMTLVLFPNTKKDPYTCFWQGDEFSLIEIIGKRLTDIEKQDLLDELNKRGYPIPDGSLPLNNLSTIVSGLLSIYNLDSKDEIKKERANREYDHWKNVYNYYREGLSVLRKKQIDPNCFYYQYFFKAESFMDFLLTKGMNLAGNFKSIKKAGKYKIDIVENKKDTIYKITEPYVESLNWKTEIFTRLASSVVVGGAVLLTAQQEAIQKLAEFLPGLGHVIYVASAILGIGFFTLSKHMLRYFALSLRNNSDNKVIKEVAKADKVEIKTGESKAAIFKLSVMEMMAIVGYWRELKNVVYKNKEPILFKAIEKKDLYTFLEQIDMTKDILLPPYLHWWQFRKKRNCGELNATVTSALNLAKEMDGVGSTSSEKENSIQKN